MPKSKPPRRRYRPLRRIHDFDERMMTMFDMLEAATEKVRQRVTPFLDQIPAKERAAWAGPVGRRHAPGDRRIGRSGVLAAQRRRRCWMLSSREDRERRRALGG
jgi:hypothetical protein